MSARKSECRATSDSGINSDSAEKTASDRCGSSRMVVVSFGESRTMVTRNDKCRPIRSSLVCGCCSITIASAACSSGTVVGCMFAYRQAGSPSCSRSQPSFGRSRQRTSGGIGLFDSPTCSKYNAIVGGRGEEDPLRIDLTLSSQPIKATTTTATAPSRPVRVTGIVAFASCKQRRGPTQRSKLRGLRVLEPGSCSIPN